MQLAGRRLAVLLTIVMMTALSITLLPQTAAASTYTGTTGLESMEIQVLNLINNHRRQNGLPALANNSRLNVSSHNHSLDMARRGYFSHTSLDGRSPFDRMRAAGYRCSTMGENIAAGQRTAQQVFDAWKRSAGHNRNMLNRNYKSVGIGLVQMPGSKYGSYWTTNFGGC
jgi:uncharacterized protein YkwD